MFNYFFKYKVLKALSKHKNLRYTQTVEMVNNIMKDVFGKKLKHIQSDSDYEFDEFCISQQHIKEPKTYKNVRMFIVKNFTVAAVMAASSDDISNTNVKLFKELLKVLLEINKSDNHSQYIERLVITDIFENISKIFSYNESCLQSSEFFSRVDKCKKYAVRQVVSHFHPQIGEKVFYWFDELVFVSNITPHSFSNVISKELKLGVTLVNTCYAVVVTPSRNNVFVGSCYPNMFTLDTKSNEELDLSRLDAKDRNYVEDVIMEHKLEVLHKLINKKEK